MIQREIWFWQRIVSPHMAGLAVALSEQGCTVHYVAERPLSDKRTRQGWIVPDLGSVELHDAGDRASIEQLADRTPNYAVHLCQGIRANGLVSVAQRAIAKKGGRYCVMMEGVDTTGYRGLVKSLVYSVLVRTKHGELACVLAIGTTTTRWLIRRGMSENMVYPFAYFLRPPEVNMLLGGDTSRRYRILFVGQLIERKRVDLLIEALRRVLDLDWELTVVGRGSSETELRTLAARKVPNRVTWLGRLTMSDVPRAMAEADCLVLPSRHDGWGAVVSEALMIGTPVICSDACGASVLAAETEYAASFPSGDVVALENTLRVAIESGPIRESDRLKLAKWARQAIGATTGAKYVIQILEHLDGWRARPYPPWHPAPHPGFES